MWITRAKNAGTVFIPFSEKLLNVTRPVIENNNKYSNIQEKISFEM